MEQHDQLHHRAEPAAAEERRRHDRQDVVSLECSHGIAVDLSAGGVRVVTRKPLEGELEIRLRRGDGPEVTMSVFAAWTKRVRRNEYLNGLEFVDVPQDLARRLAGETQHDEGKSPDGS